MFCRSCKLLLFLSWMFYERDHTILLTLYNHNYFLPQEKLIFLSVIMKFFADHFKIMKINFWPRVTLHSKSTKYGRPFSSQIFPIKYCVFGKSMNKYLLACGSYFVRNYGMKFYWNDKNAHLKKKCFCQFIFLKRRWLN